ncbi:hypothetical protein LC048_11215 [Mesobacillus subterraneus]|uniref:hypothetical protein n=1 Tax=Mesobacillus subterraneus TaxID=285983 RepID=UPI00273E0BC9|nr:hypothetical protein [Mesobacillus subterraneus]WLR57367.1 hypothetical protein LC048_11215 [Mesobacillus subterraneus]
MFLYHIVIENDDDLSIAPQRVLKEGLNRSTATRWYSRGANFFPDLTERFRPVHAPSWLDFKIAFGADLEPYEKPYFRFPVFSDKILVFNLDISSDLFAHLEDLYDGGKGHFVVGPSIKGGLNERILEKYDSSVTVFGAQTF